MKQEVLLAIEKELKKQRQKHYFGDRKDLSLLDWILAITNRVGEVAQAIIRCNEKDTTNELVDLAVYVIAWLEVRAEGKEGEG